MSKSTENYEDFSARWNAAVEQIKPDLKVTSVRAQRGHDDSQPFSANVAYKGKKYGEVFDDGWGGALQIPHELIPIARELGEKFDIAEVLEGAICELAMDALAEQEVKRFIAKSKRHYGKYAKCKGFYVLVSDEQMQTVPFGHDDDEQKVLANIDREGKNVTRVLLAK